MKINRSYNFRFYPTAEQESQLAVEFGNSRWVWNWGLSRRIAAYVKCKRELKLLEENLGGHAKFAREIIRESKFRDFSVVRKSTKVRLPKRQEEARAKLELENTLVAETKRIKYENSLNSIGLSKILSQIKKIGIQKDESSYSWLKDSTSSSQTQKLMDLDVAYKNFFEGRAGFPKFKSKYHEQSVRIQMDQRHIAKTYCAGKLLKLPVLGELNLKWSRVPQGTPKMVTVKKACTGKYYVSFSCEEESLFLLKTGKTVGVDAGVKDTLVTSDGFFSGSLKSYYKLQRELRKAQRILSRKAKGSKRREKQRILVAKIHARIANARRDFQHKLTTWLVQTYDVICMEDLNLNFMLKNPRMAKAAYDAGLGEIFRQIEYKSLWYGKEVVKISRFYPSTKTCSGCGKIHDMKLSDRVMDCDCGLKMDRDLNAAVNIKRAGIALRGVANQPAV